MEHLRSSVLNMYVRLNNTNDMYMLSKYTCLIIWIYVWILFTHMFNKQEQYYTLPTLGIWCEDASKITALFALSPCSISYLLEIETTGETVAASLLSSCVVMPQRNEIRLCPVFGRRLVAGRSDALVRPNKAKLNRQGRGRRGKWRRQRRRIRLMLKKQTQTLLLERPSRRKNCT